MPLFCAAGPVACWLWKRRKSVVVSSAGVTLRPSKAV